MKFDIQHTHHTQETAQSETEYSFRIILKFWKKESKNILVLLPESQCVSSDLFVNAIKKKFEIKRFHCLEEIWVLQIKAEYEKSFQWIHECNGRIKIHVSDSFKDLLMKRIQEHGSRDFLDPMYEIDE